MVNMSISIPDVTTDIPNIPTSDSAMEMAELTPAKRSVIQYEAQLNKLEKELQELKAELLTLRETGNDYGRIKEENIGLTTQMWQVSLLSAVGGAILSTPYEVVKNIIPVQSILTLLGWLVIIFAVFIGPITQILKAVTKKLKN